MAIPEKVCSEIHFSIYPPVQYIKVHIFFIIVNAGL